MEKRVNSSLLIFTGEICISVLFIDAVITIRMTVILCKLLLMTQKLRKLKNKNGEPSKDLITQDEKSGAYIVAPVSIRVFHPCSPMILVNY